MKILLVNWSWYATGGDWTYVENIRRLYESHGHEVIAFSTQNEKNVPSAYAKYFVQTFDFKELNKKKTLLNGIRALKTAVVSSDALLKLDRLLKDHDVKVAHLHNIHHYITPAIIETLHKKGIKILWTLHDYKIICPENSFVSNGKICEKCIDGSFYHCVINKCKKKSFLASGLASFEAYFYHKKHTYDLVDYYLCPSAFLMKKFNHFGFDKEKLVLSNLCYDIAIIDNFITKTQANSNSDIVREKYIFYIGRLEKIKGIETLIKAVKNTEIVIKIIGTGSEEDNLREMIKAEGYGNVQLLGFKNKEEVFEITFHALFGVCPSEWYENFPFSVSETFLFSKPVIGANIGGIPELVIPGKTGVLFEPGNVQELGEKLIELWNNEQLVFDLGKGAREHAFDLYNFDAHWKKLNNVLKNLFPSAQN